nr:MAG TPA: hypothetical protein [Caudoviricetes sp.]
MFFYLVCFLLPSSSLGIAISNQRSVIFVLGVCNP